MKSSSNIRVFLAAIALAVAAQSGWAQSSSGVVSIGSVVAPLSPLPSKVFAGKWEAPAVKSNPGKVWWLISGIALTAASAADLGTSVGHREANPLLQNQAGRFSAGKAVGIKMSVSGATLFLQSILGRHHPDTYRASAIINFVGAAAMGAVAAHNANTR